MRTPVNNLALRPSVQTQLASLGLGAYRDLAGLAKSWLALESAGAQLCVDGITPGGLPLVRLEIGDEARGHNIMTSGIHAFEWVGIEVGMNVFEQLVALAKSHSIPRVVYFPLLNPDGVSAVEGDLTEGRNKMRRTNSRGVDLNRNFPKYWSAKTPLTRRLMPSLGHGGAAPLSEIETKVVADRVEQILAGPHKLSRAVALHSFGGVILVPRKAQQRTVTEPDMHERLAHQIAQHMRRPFSVRSGSWPPGVSNGMELDYFASLGAASILVECAPRGGITLSPASSLLKPFTYYNPKRLDIEVSNLAPALVDYLSHTS